MGPVVKCIIVRFDIRTVGSCSTNPENFCLNIDQLSFKSSNIDTVTFLKKNIAKTSGRTVSSTSSAGCEQLLQASKAQAPSVASIFMLGDITCNQLKV